MIYKYINCAYQFTSVQNNSIIMINIVFEKSYFSNLVLKFPEYGKML